MYREIPDDISPTICPGTFVNWVFFPKGPSVSKNHLEIVGVDFSILPFDTELCACISNFEVPCQLGRM